MGSRSSRPLPAHWTRPRGSGALDKAAGEWNRVNTLLYKLHFTKKDEIKQRISRLIYEIADLEAQTADELIQFSESL